MPLQLLEFQKWLTGRTIFPAAIEGAEGAAIVSKDTSRLNFNIVSHPQLPISHPLICII